MTFDIEKIKAFSKSAASRESQIAIPKAKVIAMIFDEIETAFSNGVTHQKYVDGLNEAGMNITLGYFDNCFYGIKKKRKAATTGMQSSELSDNDTPVEKAKTTAKENDKKPSPAPLEEDSFNEAERLVGFRIPESIRSWVKVKDGRIVTVLPNSLVLNHQINNTLKKLKPYE